MIRLAGSLTLLLATGLSCSRSEESGANPLTPDSSGVVPGARPFLDENDVDFALNGLDIGGAAPLSDSELAILDFRGKRIVVFDTAGHRVREFGAAGGGPGELQFPQMLVRMQRDRIGVLDGHKRAIVVFSATGATITQYPLDSLIAAPASQLTRVQEVAEGTWFLSQYVYGPNTRYERLSRRTGAVTTPVDSTAAGPMRPTVYPCNVVDEAGQPPVFWPTVRWDAAGGVVASATSAHYHVSRWGAASAAYSDTVLPRKALRSEALLERLGGTVRTGSSSCSLSKEVALEQRSMAEVIPVLRALRVAPNGHIWAQRDSKAGTARDIDVIDSNGQKITTHSGVAMPLFFLSESTYVAMDSTDDGYVALRTWQIRRRP